ncbi:MAG: zinc ribbon domain-containing protein [Thermomicrobiales bacterium]|nr:zinc ribbon domain-containing protein [Thermomicrobiales bacterium]
MNSTARVLGIILLIAGVVVGVLIALWLRAGSSEGTLQQSGALFGGVLGFAVVVAPLVGFGAYFLIRGTAESRELAEVASQRELLAVVTTRGQVSIPDIVLQLNTTRDQVEADLLALVGRGLFSGYVDWSKGMLYSIEASQLQGRQTCPNCGGQLELVGKGLIKCPYCGAEIFLTG